MKNRARRSNDSTIMYDLRSQNTKYLNNDFLVLNLKMSGSTPNIHYMNEPYYDQTSRWSARQTVAQNSILLTQTDPSSSISQDQLIPAHIFRMFMPLGSWSDDEILVNALHDGERDGSTPKQTLEKLHGVSFAYFRLLRALISTCFYRLIVMPRSCGKIIIWIIDLVSNFSLTNYASLETTRQLQTQLPSVPVPPLNDEILTSSLLPLLAF